MLSHFIRKYGPTQKLHTMTELVGKYCGKCGGVEENTEWSVTEGVWGGREGSVGKSLQGEDIPSGD